MGLRKPTECIFMVVFATAREIVYVNASDTSASVLAAKAAAGRLLTVPDHQGF